MKPNIKIISVCLLALTAILWLASCKSKEAETHTGSGQPQTYTCSMHPQVISDRPGTCPVCGMDLVPFDKSNVSDVLTLSEPQRALANITTDTIKTGSFSSYRQLNGRLAVNPEQTEFISSRVAGRIDILYIKETGVPVSKGQPLYKIYSEQLAALQQEYLIAIAQAAQFPEDKKFQQLAEAAKEKLLLYNQSESQVQQLKNNKQTNPYVIYASPANGVVSELLITEGQYVTEGTSIMRIEGYQNIWVEADLYPGEARLVKKGDIVNVIIPGYENEAYKMKIEFIAPALQAASQLLTVRGSISNKQNELKAGMQAIVELPVANSFKAVTLPVDAVIRDGKGAHVWLETGIGKFEPRMVATGAENFNRVEITKGVAEGDVIVVSGAYLLYGEFVLKKGKNPMAAHHH
ncbi:efflux RND transporter periplasmic adaptor subunit [Agriterribacter sp.]|uniref:efflux RND transporter periplasmic adaptor subunit n=1 Tax=Agriterribacter sp. TaxID=2821509 RepID=UPI002C468DBC|nr:efflux RND transporter periplasmic adaptor subunit [Agriterribacter sp.]HTN07923.1 efflux RND transporter periplasmic adaptor subunit [Agriterribacter sp.]